MTKNSIQRVIAFVFKYVWFICAGLIIIELISTLYTGTVLMKESAKGIMESVSGEVSGRVDGVVRLLNGLASDERIANVDESLYERAILSEPYRHSYNLFMIALTDENIDVVSSDTTDPNEEKASLAYRDYMQELYATGKSQITDAFLSGADHTTMNYTIAVPIKKDDVVKGSVFGSIYFHDIQEILLRNTIDEKNSFMLFGSNTTVMSSNKSEDMDKSFQEIASDTYFIGENASTVEENLKNGIAGDTWDIGSQGLVYSIYKQVEPTNWSLVYQVNFSSVIFALLPVLLIKSCFYLLVSAIMSIFGRRYLAHQLSAVNHLLDQVTLMQKELFATEQMNYDSLLEMTQKGLSDQLTGLATRAVLLNKMNNLCKKKNGKYAIFFIDLDNLKLINDNFGHEGGDMALLQFGKTLKQYEDTYHAFSARYGGDEFILLLDGMDETKIKEIATTLLKELDKKIAIKDKVFAIHGSIGVAYYPTHGTKPEELICKADLALYSAKQAGRNKVIFYEKDAF